MKKPSLRHIPLSLLCVYLIRSLILNSVTLNEVLLCAILAGLTCFYELRLEADSVLKLKEDMKKLSENDFRQEMILQELRNAMSGINVNAGLRGLVKK